MIRFTLALGIAILSWSALAADAVVPNDLAEDFPPLPQGQVSFEIPSQAVNFGTNSANLDVRAQAYLRKLGQAMVKNAGLWQAVEITGHTDGRGNSKYNQLLSERRVKSVTQVLKESGVTDARLQARALASAQPVDSGATESAWAKNRRVELLFLEVSDPKALQKILGDVKF